MRTHTYLLKCTKNTRIFSEKMNKEYTRREANIRPSILNGTEPGHTDNPPPIMNRTGFV